MSYGDSVPPPVAAIAEASAAPRVRAAAFARFCDAFDALLAQSHDALRERLGTASDRSIDEPSAVRYAIYRCIREFVAGESLIRRNVRRRIAAGLDRAIRPTAPGPLPEFRLMNDDQLEEAVLCATLTAVSETACAEALRILVREVIGQGEQYAMPPWVDELRPRALLQCYLAEINNLVALEPEVRIEVLRAFEKGVLARLPAAYLDAAGVVNGRRSDARSEEPTAPAASIAAKAALSAEPTTAAAGPQPRRNALEDVLAVLAGRHRSKSVAAGAATLDRADLAHALHTFQWRARSRHAAEIWSDCDVRLAELVKRAVQLDRGRALDQPLNEADQATIDVVEFVFDFLVPPSGRAPLSEGRLALRSLKLPYLRLALIDRNALADRESAARRLLEEAAGLAEAAETQGDEATLLGNLAQVASDVWIRFDSDPTAFGAILDDFHSRADPLRRSAERKERRVIERLEARDRLLSAWRDVAERFHPERLRALPELVAAVLARPVAQHLVLLHVRGGGPHGCDYVAASEAWMRVLESCSVGGGRIPPSGRHAAMRALAQAAGWLRHALSDVGYTEGDKILLWRALCECTMGTMRGAVQDFVRGTGPDIAEAFQRFGLDLPDYVRSAGAAASTDMDAVSAGSVSVGQWVEFCDGACTTRLKLCWRSRFTRLNIFVDRSGKQALELGDAELSQKLRDGVLAIVSRGASVDRALGNILAQVRTAST